jgi:acetyl-CoA carboxylase carboxyl transferase subunit alpha
MEAAAAMKMTAPDLLRLGIIDEVIREAPGGAHRDYDTTADNVKAAIARHLRELAALSPAQLVEQRYQKFRAMGAFVESNEVAK